jgi:hypothetical protein
MANQRVWSNTGIHGGITIPAGGATLTFTVNGQHYSVTVPAASHTGNRNTFTNTLIAALNTALASTPVQARLGGIHDDSYRNVVILENKVSDPTKPITNIGGSISSLIFGGSTPTFHHTET